MTFRENSISEKCARLMPQAIKEVSNAGQMKYSQRNLYYKVRELFLRTYKGEAFFKLYSSFTQDFLSAYQAQFGILKGKVAEARGYWTTVKIWGTEEGRIDGSAVVGRANKVILVEKEGLYEVMKENNFHKLLDCLIICTKGFSSEETRRTLIRMEQAGLPIFVVHDYDINGILIRTTLHENTKRRAFSLEGKTHDLGFTLQDLKELDLLTTAEPVKLGKQDQTKLHTLLDTKQISEEEFYILENERVELNALTPLDFLEFLTTKLIALGYGKTLPTEEELERKLEEMTESHRAFEIDREARKASEIGFTELAIWMDDLNESLAYLKQTLRGRAKKYIDNELPEYTLPALSVAEVGEWVKDEPLRSWNDTVDAEGSDLIDEVGEEAKEDYSQRTAIIYATEGAEVIKAFQVIKDLMKHVANDTYKA